MSIRYIGGAYNYFPPNSKEELSDGAVALLEKSLEGVDNKKNVDYHTHIIDLGNNNTGCFVNPKMNTWFSPIKKFQILICFFLI